MAEPDSLREFEFLPNLPKSNLDDRTFNDLVQECILRIPRYCPEWTNHNPGDPGITIIELFAWLTDQMLFRFNQVPRRYYVAFLELLGIYLRPPVPAHADLTFYLSKAQAEPKRIPAGTEVATVRTETEEAVVFTTEQDLIVGQPQIRHLLSARSAERLPQAERLTSLFDADDETLLQGMGNTILFETCEPQNCFYLVLTSSNTTASNLTSVGLANTAGVSDRSLIDSIEGNVLALTFRGSIAGTTGINPDDPPLRWEAWTGEKWVTGILRERQDDKTKGFSFSELGQQAPNPEQEGADVILHLPQEWDVQEFGGYQGHWLRCVYVRPEEWQYGYDRSPMINSVTVRAIGGTVRATECVRIENEPLGISDGKPGQSFQLQEGPVLQRNEAQQEYVQVTPPGELPEVWHEVPDFSNSTADDRHYVINSQMGTVQFGPLVREPDQLQQRLQERSRLQPWGKRVQRSRSVAERELTRLSETSILSSDMEATDYQEQQYGQIPPIGSEIEMVSYRVGGGSRGNVDAEKLTVLKTAIPYVKRVTNYERSRGGREAESLDEAVMRVPQILRTSRAAVTPEDFETIARSSRSVYRAHCLPCDTPGCIDLRLVPDPRADNVLGEEAFRREFPNGMQPDDYFTLEPTLKKEVMAEIEQRKLLGVQVDLKEPDYVGVRVMAEVLLEKKYSALRVRDEMSARLINQLYYFLNPITGGFDRDGWSLGRSITCPDIIGILQDLAEVQYVGAVKLFSIRKFAGDRWFVNDIPELTIEPGRFGLICSWDDHRSDVASAHAIEFMD